MSPPKVTNSILKDLNNSEVDEISNNEQSTVIRTVNKTKEDIYISTRMNPMMQINT
jgi:hypothetical protein